MQATLWYLLMEHITKTSSMTAIDNMLEHVGATTCGYTKEQQVVADAISKSNDLDERSMFAHQEIVRLLQRRLEEKQRRRANASAA